MRIRPPPVEINAGQRAPRVADDDAIGVEHREELDDVVAQDPVVLLGIASDLVHQVLHYQRAMGLRGVQTCLNVYHSLLLMLNRIFASLGNRQLIQVEAAHALPDNLLPVMQKLIDDLEIEILG